MTDEDLQLKAALFEICKSRIDDQIKSLEQNLRSIEEARNNETKSSVGDKYETGRAMMQIEEDQIKTQLLRNRGSRNQLTRIDPTQETTTVQPGSVVFTDKGKYFISIGLGKVKLANEQFYCISVDSPIGSKLQRQQAGTTIEFNGRSIKIEKVV